MSAHLPSLSRLVQLRSPGRWLPCTGAGVLLVLLSQSPALGQQGIVTGTVVDAEIAEPLTGVLVELITGGGRVVLSTTTDVSGQFRIAEVPAGSYSLILSTLGYAKRRVDGVAVAAAVVPLGTLELVSRVFKLNPVVVTASRRQEKALEAPAAVYTVDAEAIEARPATTSVEHVKGLPGVDVVTTGLAQHNVVARGFNNIFSGALFVLTDNRWASVPSLRFNAYNLIPTANEDIERIEFVLGPGSALYGPNVDKGVMHIITRSPLDHQGTTVSLAVGERDLFQGSFRHAALFSENVGYKISGMYFRGDDWEFIDPVEAAARADAIRELLNAGQDTSGVRIGLRDFNAERFTGDARVDFRLDPQTTLTLSGGLSGLLTSVELTGAGGAQADDWVYSYLQARFRRGQLFAQAYINRSDAGDSFLLEAGNPLVDNSLLYVGQVQHATALGERQRFIYGADLIRTIPRTDGTIHGRNEDGDEVTEIGGYVQSETALSPQFDLVLAGRLDYHNVIDDLVLSPRAALVFKPTPEHTFRATYNRAFSQPTSINFSLDLETSSSLGPFADFAVRTSGVPSETGFTFRRNCSGGLCMRSPFSGNPSEFLALDATPFWDNALDQLNPVLALQGRDTLPTATIVALRSLDISSDVGTVLKAFDRENLAFGGILSPDQAVADIDPLTPQIANTLEAGYKGLISDRLLLGIDVYYTRIENFIGPLRFETPNVFLNPTDLGDNSGLLVPALLAEGVPAEQIVFIIGTLANTPLGTVTPEQVPDAFPADLYLTYRNFGEVDLWGTDIAVSFLATDELSFSGSYSFVSDDFFANLDGIGDIALNAPKNKAAFSGQYRNERLGVSVQLRGRYVDSFPVTSGVVTGTVDSYTLLDAIATYAFPFARSTEATLSAINVFDDDHQEMVRAPFIGRLLLLRLRQSF